MKLCAASERSCSHWRNAVTCSDTMLPGARFRMAIPTWREHGEPRRVKLETLVKHLADYAYELDARSEP